MAPSTWGGTRESSWHLEDSIKAFPRIRERDILPNNWLVTSPSWSPLLLARAAAICLTCVAAPAWKPPSVSMANGRKTKPSWRQASAVSLSFLWQAFANAAPGSAAAADTLEAASGPVTVTSMAASFPFAQRRIMTSPGLALVPGSRCLSSLVGPRSALDAASNMTSLSMLCLAILSPDLGQPRAWSPIRSLGEEQAVQGPSEERIGRPNLYLRTGMNSGARTWRPRAGRTTKYKRCVR